MRARQGVGVRGKREREPFPPVFGVILLSSCKKYVAHRGTKKQHSLAWIFSSFFGVLFCENELHPFSSFFIIIVIISACFLFPFFGLTQFSSPPKKKTFLHYCVWMGKEFFNLVNLNFFPNVSLIGDALPLSHDKHFCYPV